MFDEGILKLLWRALDSECVGGFNVNPVLNLKHEIDNTTQSSECLVMLDHHSMYTVMVDFPFFLEMILAKD